MQRTSTELAEIKRVFGPNKLKALRIRWKRGEGPTLIVKGRMEEFLYNFRENWNVKLAAEVTGITVSRPYVWGKKWPEFRLAMEQMIPERLGDGEANLFKLMYDENPKVAALSTFFYLNSAKEAKEAGWGQHNVIEHRITLTKEERDAKANEAEKAALTYPPGKLLSEGKVTNGEIIEIETKKLQLEQRFK